MEGWTGTPQVVGCHARASEGGTGEGLDMSLDLQQQGLQSMFLWGLRSLQESFCLPEQNDAPVEVDVMAWGPLQGGQSDGKSSQVTIQQHDIGTAGDSELKDLVDSHCCLCKGSISSELCRKDQGYRGAAPWHVSCAG